MGKILRKLTLKEVLMAMLYITIFNVFLTLMLVFWVTDDDLNNLPKTWEDRFISIFYYLITTFTTTGYGDIYAKSSRMKLIISVYMIVVCALTVSILIDY
jgi:hypothetical protein